jgi:hypothetical protein
MRRKGEERDVTWDCGVVGVRSGGTRRNGKKGEEEGKREGRRRDRETEEK